MKLSITLFLLFYLINSNSYSQIYFPGGVTGAEVWYVAHHDHLSNGNFKNLGIPHLTISGCSEGHSKSLFNFNHSFKSTPLCLSYHSPLENDVARNIFFVGESRLNDQTEKFSLATTDWKYASNLPKIKNRFDLGNKNVLVGELFNTGDIVLPKASISFYHWNIYQTDQKFKSFGYDGETTFKIGKKFINSIDQFDDFEGNFPEFISFPFELSANQKNRVESYLAIKYGFTLDKNVSYRDSKNVVIWKNTNNERFKNYIFGLGRDNISNLHQLQSETVHNKNFLIASLGKLEETNLIKQEQFFLKNKDFIVFGDNGESRTTLQNNLSFGVRSLFAKWLSQNTGESSNENRIFFKLNINGEIATQLQQDPSLKLWMLHDRFVNNQEISSFNNQYVDFREAVSVEDFQYGYFEDIQFDIDKGLYDQFTFGVGPKMIVQVRFDENCKGNPIASNIIITGGKAPYDIIISNNNGSDENLTSNSQTVPFVAIGPATYTVIVKDATGFVVETDVDVVPTFINTDLGPDQILNASNQQVTLDAGTYNPAATYLWYLDGVLMSEITPTITVTTPGEYKVVVTSANRMCVDEDKVVIDYRFGGLAEAIVDCDDQSGIIDLAVSGGIPPFTTTISSVDYTIIQVHSLEHILINDIPFGNYTITTSDSNNELFTQTVEIANPLGGIFLNIVEQLNIKCINTFNEYAPEWFDSFICNAENETVILDASQLITNSNVSYEWYMNGVSLQIFDPIVEMVSDQNLYTDYYDGTNTNLFEIKVTNLSTNCSVQQFFGIFKYTGLKTTRQNFTKEVAPKALENQDGNSNHLLAKIYPNPASPTETFFYEISSSEKFNGKVEVFSPSGALLRKVDINGESNYVLPFNLSPAGVYLIRTTTENAVLTNKVIIR